MLGTGLSVGAPANVSKWTRATPMFFFERCRITGEPTAPAARINSPDILAVTG